MRTSNPESSQMEQKAKDIVLGGVASSSTSVDGMSVSKTHLDPMKVLETANALDARKASKNPMSQIKFMKIKD